jgi:lipoprotein-releasing system permease protein
MRLAWSIAFRFLKSGRGQTVLIALGIAIGVSAQVFIGSLIGGLQDSLVDRTIGSASHIMFLPAERNKILRKIPR